MQIPNISLSYLLAELKPVVEGSILRKVQELENNRFKLKLQTRQGTKDLIIVPEAIFLTSYSLPAKQLTSGFGAFLRKRISNKKILSLKQQGLDRIVLLEFDEYFLILELFAKGNIILTTKDFEIVSAYRKEQWKDRKVSKGEEYKFPSSKGLNPLEIDEKELKPLFLESNADSIRTLVSKLNIAPVVGEEAFLIAGVEKSTPATELKSGELSKVLKELKQLYYVELQKSKPVLAAGQILPFEMKAAGAAEKEFPSINSALDGHFSAAIAEKKSEAPKTSLKQAKLENNLKIQLDSQKSLGKKVIEEQAIAESIYSNYAAINQALNLARALEKAKMEKEDVMYKLSELGLELKQIDLKNKKIYVTLKK